MTGAFWTFSLGLYARPGISPALIRWQDEGGADVDLVLYILWRASRGEPLDEAALRTADQAVAAWRDDVLRPLRRIRIALKPSTLDGAQALRERVEADELEAERLQHAILESLAPKSLAPKSLAPESPAPESLASAARPVDPTPALALYARLLAASAPPWPGVQEVVAVLAKQLPQ